VSETVTGCFGASETSPMAKQLLFRTASAAGLLALALFFVGADPFLSAGADLTNTFTVNRVLKGDRLPVSVVPDWNNAFGTEAPGPHAQTPFACDAAFSAISSTAASNYFGRCMA
jgi:hypothetical protein